MTDLLIRMMTFNVFTTDIPEDDVRNPNDVWSYRSDLNVKTILKYQPDVMGFQEYDDGHRATYKDHLREYDVFDPATESEGSGLAIYWKRDKFRRLDAGKFWVTRNPEDPAPDWGLEYSLGAIWTLLECVETGSPLLFLNTHYEDGPWGEEMRREGTKVILSQIDRIAPGAPAVVVADFNTNPWSHAYRIYKDAGFMDAYREAGHGDSAGSSTYHGLRGEDYFALEWGVETFWRVDWIMLRDGAQRWQTTSCTIARDAEPPIYPSDHYPVVAEALLE